MMDAEFKQGDEVYYKRNPVESGSRSRYKVQKVEQNEIPEEAKQVSNEQQSQSLYGKEIEKVSQPALTFLIKPLGGGETIKVSQGEIELAR